MRDFNIEEFKKGGIAVYCSTEEIAYNFLEKCKNADIKWVDGDHIIPSDNYFNEDSRNICYLYENNNGIYYSIFDSIKEGCKTIEWGIDAPKEEKKVYKIQDLFNDNSLEDRLAKCIQNERVYKIGFSDLYEINIESNYQGTALSDDYNLKYIATLEFELIEEEAKEVNVTNKDSKIYIAGSLFNQGEIAQRKNEENSIKQLGFKNIYNPINAPCNDKEDLPTSADIFWGDTNEVLSSDVVIADISNPTDLGVACESGIIWACNHLHFLAEEGLTLEEILTEMKKKKLIAHLSDIRKSTAHQYRGNNVPFGVNQYLIGAIEDIGVVKDNFKEVLEELKKGDK